jgi:hypothetical protein
VSERPHLRIVKGNPSDEEIAALVAVVSSLGAAEAPSQPKQSVWSDRRALVREPMPHGPGAWRASGFPR